MIPNFPIGLGALVITLSLAVATVTFRYLWLPRGGRHARTTGGNP
ncbi:hypothetical protein [Streptomyces sp. NPDC088733]